jgi:hypothetical protein
MFKINIPVATWRALDRLYVRTVTFRAALLNRSVPLRRIKEYMVGEWQTNFDNQGGMYGAWDALEEDWTVIDRITGGYGGDSPILEREGTLRGHFLGQADAGDVGTQALQWNFFSADGAWLMTHQFGMPNPLPDRDPIPPRPMFGINPNQEEHMVDITEEWVSQIVAQYYS